jgi:hydroxymethylpyrimidine pyrophosphatase-like HAD family hydrolase
LITDAIDEVKKRAHLIIGSNDEDSVAKFIICETKI